MCADNTSVYTAICPGIGCDDVCAYARNGKYVVYCASRVFLFRFVLHYTILLTKCKYCIRLMSYVLCQEVSQCKCSQAVGLRSMVDSPLTQSLDSGSL